MPSFCLPHLIELDVTPSLLPHFTPPPSSLLRIRTTLWRQSEIDVPQSFEFAKDVELRWAARISSDELRTVLKNFPATERLSYFLPWHHQETHEHKLRLLGNHITCMPNLLKLEVRPIAKWAHGIPENIVAHLFDEHPSLRIVSLVPFTPSSTRSPPGYSWFRRTLEPALRIDRYEEALESMTDNVVRQRLVVDKKCADDAEREVDAMVSRIEA